MPKVESYLEEFSAATLRKAKSLIETEGALQRDEDHPEVWTVRGSKPYRVQSDYEDGEITWISCSCPNGQNQSFGKAKCYHAAAVLASIKGE